MQRMQHDTSIIGGGLHRKEADGRHGMEVVGSVEAEASNNVFFWAVVVF